MAESHWILRYIDILGDKRLVARFLAILFFLIPTVVVTIAFLHTKNALGIDSTSQDAREY